MTKKNKKNREREREECLDIDFLWKEKRVGCRREIGSTGGVGEVVVKAHGGNC